MVIQWCRDLTTVRFRVHAFDLARIVYCSILIPYDRALAIFRRSTTCAIPQQTLQARQHMPREHLCTNPRISTTRVEASNTTHDPYAPDSAATCTTDLGIPLDCRRYAQRWAARWSLGAAGKITIRAMRNGGRSAGAYPFLRIGEKQTSRTRLCR